MIKKSISFDGKRGKALARWHHFKIINVDVCRQGGDPIGAFGDILSA
jgi:hypothetical protein